MNNWDNNYSGEEYRYGREAVPFLREAVADLKPGRALCIGAGEGRNAVWLAQQGWDVTALDLSEVGLEKARKLAGEQGVSINTVAGDASTHDMGDGRWNLITEFFVHTPPDVRARIHSRVETALAPGGRFVLEAFTPRQLDRNTGGPGTSQTGPAPQPEEVAQRFIEPDELRQQMAGLDFLRLEEEVIALTGGTHHDGGEGAVVHCVADKR